MVYIYYSPVQDQSLRWNDYPRLPAKMFLVSICDLYCHPNAEKLNTAMENEPFVDA